MSGHSKWATIKRKKAATDQARGKLFSKYIKEITIAARHGGGDAEANPRLRSAVAAAKAVNMPASHIELALDAGADDVNSEGDAFEVLTPPNQFEAVRDAIAKRGIAAQSAELTKIASQQVPLSEKDAAAVLKLVDALEDHDDVQKVY